MTEPTRLLQTRLDATERRAILAAVSDEPPPGAEARIWQALAVALPATGVLVGATTATGAAHAAAGGAIPTVIGSAAKTAGAAGVASTGLGIVAGKAIAIGLGIGLTLNAATLAVTRQQSPVLARAPSGVPVERAAPEARVNPVANGDSVSRPPSEVTRVELARPASPSVAARATQVTTAELQQREEPQSDALADESSLITRARRALQAGNVTSAMAGIDEHRRRFPTGVLTQECDALTVLVHERAGELDVARALATEFLVRYPSSPHAEKMRSIAQSR